MTMDTPNKKLQTEWYIEYRVAAHLELKEEEGSSVTRNVSLFVREVIKAINQHSILCFRGF